MGYTYQTRTIPTPYANISDTFIHKIITASLYLQLADLPPSHRLPVLHPVATGYLIASHRRGELIGVVVEYGTVRISGELLTMDLPASSGST